MQQCGKSGRELQLSLHLHVNKGGREKGQKRAGGRQQKGFEIRRDALRRRSAAEAVAAALYGPLAISFN